jgi:hypothetical protein
MKTILQIVLLTVAVAGFASAWTPAVPEISGNGLVSAVGLVAGGMLVFRASRKK